jgi:hypothetical protein
MANRDEIAAIKYQSILENKLSTSKAMLCQKITSLARGDKRRRVAFFALADGGSETGMASIYRA